MKINLSAIWLAEWNVIIINIQPTSKMIKIIKAIFLLQASLIFY